MKFAIIAAGDGSRLAQEGARLPKPLVNLNGMPMVVRLIEIFLHNGAHEVDVIINNHQPETLELLREVKKDIPIKLIVKDTQSSLHSFYELSSLLQYEKFCLTTVDTIFSEKEFGRFVRAFEASDDDGLFGVTSFVDDEKPLYVAADENQYITGFFDDNLRGHCRYVSGGIYGLTPKALPLLRKCVGQGVSRMRNFQRYIIGEGLRIKAFPFEKIIDVDHFEDIEKAETWLRQEI